MKIVEEIVFLTILEYKHDTSKKILKKIQNNEELTSDEKGFLEDMLLAYIDIASQEIERIKKDEKKDM